MGLGSSNQRRIRVNRRRRRTAQPPSEKVIMKKAEMVEKKIRTQNFRRSMKWFMESFEFLYDALVKNKEKEVEVKITKKRKILTLKGLCNKYVGSGEHEVIDIRMSPTERALLMQHLKEEKGIKIITDIKSGYLDEEYKIQRLASWATRSETYMKDGKIAILPINFGIYKQSKPSAMIIRRDTEQIPYVTLISMKNKAEEVLNWFTEMRKKHSPFRGRVSVIDKDGLNFASQPKKVFWEDMIENKDVYEEFDIITKSTENPVEFKKKNAPIKRGILFVSPPGTGKTMHVECLITIMVSKKMPVFVIRGVGKMSLGEVYDIAQGIGPSLVVLEDIDTIVKDREEGSYGGITGSLSVLQELLNILDGTEVVSNIITIATTNLKSKVDRALAARPGRFDMCFKLQYPGQELKRKLFKHHFQDMSISLDLEKAMNTREGKEVLMSPGITPAHIRGIAESIARDRAAQNGKKRSNLDRFKKAATSVMDLVDVDDNFVEKSDSLGFSSED